VERGPRPGDEPNLIEKVKNYWLAAGRGVAELPPSDASQIRTRGPAEKKRNGNGIFFKRNPVEPCSVAGRELIHQSKARSRLPLSLSLSGACHSRSLFVRQPVPSLMPSFFTPLTRRIPAAAKSGPRRPQSAASYARRRTAPSLRLIVPEARCRDTRCIRYRTTTALSKASRGLGGHLKTGHRRTLQNRPTEENQNKIIYTLREGARANIFVRLGLAGLY